MRGMKTVSGLTRRSGWGRQLAKCTTTPPDSIQRLHTIPQPHHHRHYHHRRHRRRRRRCVATAAAVAAAVAAAAAAAASITTVGGKHAAIL